MDARNAWTWAEPGVNERAAYCRGGGRGRKPALSSMPVNSMPLNAGHAGGLGPTRRPGEARHRNGRYVAPRACAHGLPFGPLEYLQVWKLRQPPLVARSPRNPGPWARGRRRNPEDVRFGRPGLGVAVASA